MTAKLFLFAMVILHQPFSEIRKMPLNFLYELSLGFKEFVMDFLGQFKNKLHININVPNEWIPNITPAWEEKPKNELRDW